MESRHVAGLREVTTDRLSRRTVLGRITASASVLAAGLSYSRAAAQYATPAAATPSPPDVEAIGGPQFRAVNYPLTAEQPDLAEAGWLWLRHNAVNNPTGTGLVFPEPASRIQIFASDVYWSFRWDSQDARIATVTGSEHPEFRYGIFFWQEGEVSSQWLTGDSSATAQEFQISNTFAGIEVNVNDSDEDAYEDNWGSFDIYVQLLQT